MRTAQAWDARPLSEDVQTLSAAALQAVVMRKRLAAALGEVEDFVMAHLRRVPLLAPYAEKPHSMRVVYLLAAAPLLAILLPLLMLTGAPPLQSAELTVPARAHNGVGGMSSALLRRSPSGPAARLGSQQQHLCKRAQQRAAACRESRCGQEEVQGAWNVHPPAHAPLTCDSCACCPG
jgi:hypothetical protein